MANTIQPITLPPQAQAHPVKDPPGGAQGAKPAEASGDSLELRRHSPQQLLNQQIMQAIGSLNSHLEMEGFQAIEELEPADYTPEKVSDRILNFIDLALKRAEANGVDGSELEKMREQARAGVEDGYKQAYDMLDGLGILEDKVKEGVEKTYELLQQGLDRMDSGEPLLIAQQDWDAMEIAAQSEQRSLSLAIETRDGDKVSINLQRSSSSSSASYDSQNGDEQISLRLDKQSSHLSFEYQVEGALDQDEEKAIKDLLRDIDRLADDFFAGNTPDLLKSSLKSGFDGSELNGFNLNISHTQTSIAARAYQSVERIQQEPAEDEGDRGIPLGQLLQQLRDMGEGPGLALGKRFEQDPPSLMRDLLAQRLELDPRFDSVFGSGNEDQPETPQTFTEQILAAVGGGQEQQA